MNKDNDEAVFEAVNQGDTGGTTLDNQNEGDAGEKPVKIRNPKRERIIIAAIVGLVLLIIGILLFRRGGRRD